MNSENKKNSDKQDDNLEFEKEILEEITNKEPLEDETISSTTGLSINKKKALRKKANESHLSKTQQYEFLAGVELDLIRKNENRLGIEELFNIYCVKGSRYWLNPLKDLARIDDILLKFAGKGKIRITILRQIVKLLIDLGKEGINPTAFLKYVIISRLQGDNNFRKWIDNHFGAFRLISNILKEMREKSPFNKEVLGNKINRLTRDIVLVKYAGKPLSRFPEHQLSDKSLNERYMEAWAKLNLDNSFTILFLKTNVLHFMYVMSGKIDYQQLITIIEHLPEIEEGFRINFPDNYFSIDISKINMNLYNYDIHSSIESRRQKGYKKYDFVLEIKAYLKIIVALLNTHSGIYLCGYFARKLSAAKDPEIASSLARLISVIDDRGGKFIYIWHTKKLLKKRKTGHSDYIDFIEHNGGYDPDYPSIAQIFHDQEVSETALYDLQQIAAHLGLTNEDLLQTVRRRIHQDQENEIMNTILENIQGIKNIPDFTFRDILSAYMHKNPGSKSVIELFQTEFLDGKDREWDMDFISKADELGKNLHGPLLQSIIKGLRGQYYGMGFKSGSFEQLNALYGKINKQKTIPLKTDFEMPVKQIGTIDKLKAQEIRNKIHIAQIQTVYRLIQDRSEKNIEDIIRFINKYSYDLNTPVQERQSEKLLLEKKKESTGGQNQELLEKIKKCDLAVTILKEKKEQFEKLLDLIPGLNEEEKLFTALIVAARTSKPGDDFSTFVMRLILQRYEHNAALARRLEFLRADIAIEMITYKQLNYIINTLDLLFQLVTEDKAFIHILDSIRDENQELSDALVPFVITRKKEILEVTIDAALNKITLYKNLTRERAKWLEIIESIDNRRSRYFKKYQIYVSKSFLDIYYGDMGGTCLSLMSEAILRPQLFNLRLVSVNDKEIIGMGLICGSSYSLSCYNRKIKYFWHAFALNPLHSYLCHLSSLKQLYLYLHYRLIFEKLSFITKKPIVLSGIGSWGIVSNDNSFRELIIDYEKQFKPKEVFDAYGVSLYYTEKSFAHAFIIIDPYKKETFFAEREINRIKIF